MDVIKEAKQVFQLEGKSVAEIAKKIDQNFAEAIELLYNCRGRIIITGIGKSGLVGRKISSTFSSTGSPTIFLHPAEAQHGDLGIVTTDDVVIAISYSGNTEELLSLLPYFKRFGIKIIAVTGNPQSSLAKNSDVYLDVGISREACPFGTIPTTSSTATLVMGDALAICLLKKRNLKKEDFALFHPGGTIGKTLLLRVKELMHTGDENPVVNENVSLKEAIYEMTSKGLGMTSVAGNRGKLVGIVTDGDLRRILEREGNVINLPVKKVMTRNPKTIAEDTLAAQALMIMEKYSITSLVAVDDKQRPYGVIHLHDILKAGIS
jgi:arabinose-5-phosphate isomerase